MATIKEFVGRNVNSVGLRKKEFEKKIKENNKIQPVIAKFEKRHKEESIKPISIPGIFSQKPKSEIFISRLKNFESDNHIKKMSKTRFQFFQESSSVHRIRNASHQSVNISESDKSIIPEIFKRS